MISVSNRCLLLFQLIFIRRSITDWILSNAIKRFPLLGESECDTLITGADSYTPDGRLIMNESAEVCLSFFPYIYINRYFID